jgi:outer membrane receptor for ferrienterochelin and colicins
MRRTALTLAAAAAVHGLAGAQGTTPSITVTGSAAQERRDEVSGKQVFTAGELARHGDTRLGDALRRVPGLSVGGATGEPQIRLDGLSAEQTLVLLNGEPVPRGQVLEALSLGQVDRIEIVRGANVQWSGRGLAGTVNIVTRQVPRSAQRDASLTLGRHFGHATGQAEASAGDKTVGPWGTLGWRLGLALRAEREQYPLDQQLRFGDTGTQVRSAYRVQTLEKNRDEALTLTPQLQWARADGTQLQGDAVLSASRLVGAGDDLRSEVQGELPRMQADRLAYKHRRAFARLGLKGRWPVAADTTLSASITASRGRRVQDSLLTGVDFAGVAVRDSTVDSTRVDDLLSARTDLQHRLGAAHTLTAGLQLEGNRRQEDRVQREGIPSWVPDLTDERYDAASGSVAAYLQDDWLVDKALTLSLGARLEHLRTRSEGNVFDGVRRKHQLGSPMLNLLWRPDARTQWKAGLSRAFRLPEPRDIMPRRWTRPENSSLVPDFIGNPGLQPEASWTLTVGWDRRGAGPDASRDGDTLSLNGVLKRVDDVIVDELIEMNGAYLLRRTNAGRAWVATLQAQWQGEWAAPWGGAVQLTAGAGARASRLSALPGPDNRLPEQAPWDLRLEAMHQPPGSRWSYSARWQWQAGFEARTPSDRVLGKGARHSADLSATWQPTAADRWRLSVSGLAASDELDTVLRRTGTTVDRSRVVTDRQPRWRVQWLHRF